MGTHYYSDQSIGFLNWGQGQLPPPKTRSRTEVQTVSSGVDPGETEGNEWISPCMSEPRSVA